MLSLESLEKSARGGWVEDGLEKGELVAFVVQDEKSRIREERKWKEGNEVVENPFYKVWEKFEKGPRIFKKLP